tara:strand:- start:2907 stop:3224 length:318 start_codon:yes stop_codon:yes gene_type:complete
MDLDKTMIKAVASEVVTLLKSDPVADTEELAEGTKLDSNGEVTYTDPTAKICDEVEARALESLPMGQKVYRSKNGSQVINHSAESLTIIDNYRKNRKHWGTRSRI